MVSSTTRPSKVPSSLIHRSMRLAGENEFHLTVPGFEFDDEHSVRHIIAFVTVHLYCPIPEHTNT